MRYNWNLEFEISIYRHFLCNIAAKSWLASRKWWRKPEYTAKTTAYPQVTGFFLTCPGRHSTLGINTLTNLEIGKNRSSPDFPLLRAMSYPIKNFWE